MLEDSIKSEGRYYMDYEGENFSLNDCEIWTKLIQEAGRRCDRYASDLLVSYDVIKRDLKELVKNKEERTWLFGFRLSGVDPTSWVENDEENPEYITIWKLELKGYELIVRNYLGFSLELSRIK
jgi:hypothetical protein